MRNLPLIVDGNYDQIAGFSEVNEDGSIIRINFSSEAAARFKGSNLIISFISGKQSSQLLAVVISPEPVSQAKEKQVSADNGVYILHDRKAGTFRVAHAQAIDNLDWWMAVYEDALKANGDTTPYVEPWNDGRTYPSAKAGLETYIRQVWGLSPIYRSEQDAVMAAWTIQKGLDICEYGISQLVMPDIEVDWTAPLEV